MEMMGAEAALKNFSDLSDEMVVARVLAGEKLLFEVIMRRLNQRLFRVTRSILKNDDEAEDVMQDAYVRAFANLAQFQGRSSFSTWLIKIAVHESFARLKKQGRRVDLDVETDRLDEKVIPMVRHVRTPEDQASVQELAHVLETVIDELPDGQRTVFMMREVEGLTTRDVAECLELTEEAVKVRLHRARQTLRRAIDERITKATRNTFLYLAPRCNRMVRAVFTSIETV